jgi:maltose/moltooligosaccharide transporter
MENINKDAASPVPGGRPEEPAIRLKYKRTLLIGLGFMTTGIAWAYYNFQIPLILRDFLGTGAGVELLIGFLMTLDNLIAVPVQPFFGALSDRLESRFGRRMPLIILGIIGAAVFFIIAPFVPDIVPFIAVIICFNIMMALYRAPVVALMPDLTPAPVRSKGNALINLMGGIGFVLAFVGRLFSDRSLGFISVSIMMLISLVILFITIKETPTGKGFFHVGKEVIYVDPRTQQITPREVVQKEDAGRSKSRWGDLKDIYREKDKSGIWMLLAIFMLVFGYQALDTFYSTLLKEFFLADPIWLAAHPLTGDALTEAAEKAAAGVLILLPVMFILAAIPGGYLGEKIGRRLTIKIGFLIMAVAVIIVWILPINVTISPIIIYIAGIGYGFANVNTIVVIWQMAPKGRVGSYTGVYYLFSILAAILSPTLIGGIFELVKLAGVTGVTVYTAIFPYILVCVVLALLFISRVKRGEAKMTKEEVAALQLEFEQDD